jgi:hypothetical protein
MTVNSVWDTPATPTSKRKRVEGLPEVSGETEYLPQHAEIKALTNCHG